MSIRKKSFAPGEYYHVYNRGNDKRVIFHDAQDYERYISLLYVCNSSKKIALREIGKEPFLFDRQDQLVAIGAYCLMPNHFHLLLTPLGDRGVSTFMQKVTTAYSMYYNNKYVRIGSLFEGKFKSEHAASDRYLKYLFSYIHLNPLKLIDKNWKKKGMVHRARPCTFLQQYLYSSFHDYTAEPRKQTVLLGRSYFPEYFPTKKSFLKEIGDWIFYQPHLQGKTLGKQV
jgi:REP element-mobilizing transposase RayT